MLQDQILRTARHWKCGQSNSGRGSHDGDTPAARRRTVMTIYDHVRHVLRTAKWAARFQRNRLRTNGTIFDRIYANSIWGGKPGEIYSGSGSEGHVADAYVTAVLDFLAEIRCHTVVDIGCGDFRIGSKIAAAVPRYVGVDVSRILIERNKSLHHGEGISFQVCDAEHDELPSGDACLVRQVLQHLSNRSIEAILQRLIAAYQYVIITEHLPAPRSLQTFNLDKPTGADVRVGYGSGVYVDQPPFGRTVDRVLLDLPLTKEQSHCVDYSLADPRTWDHIKTVVIAGRGM